MSREEFNHSMRDAEMKRIVKDAIREWLDEQFAKFGRWSLYTVLALATASILYLSLFANGWHKP